MEGELQTERVALTCRRDWLDRVDDWRFAARIPSRAQAIRTLAELGMKTQTTPGDEIAVHAPDAAETRA